MAATRSSAYRRYFRRHIGFTVIYLAAIALASWQVPDDARPSLGTVLIALLPGLAVVGWIWSMGRLLVELDDEYMRMLEVRKFIIATGSTLAVVNVWGIIELYTAVPRLPVFFVFPLWCLGLGIGGIANRLSFGHDTGRCR
ncbi:hypothetical protein [Croceicoccus sp. BE223]|uniref:hypothetical protein n=1 Tax=Croceicoccus sp. BE223 TaxID=2817716 RepID=UPI00285F97E2|nr:hypothetical protein [Croceicoccus sp. BE223]MDR7100911.1 hypothetical protein [Croceicoccus sp. BE223]